MKERYTLYQELSEYTEPLEGFTIVDVRVAYIRKLAILGDREPPGYSQLQPSILFLSLGPLDRYP